MIEPRKMHRAAWTETEDAELRRRCEAGDYIEDIAKSLGRSAEAVRTRANVLHIACRSGRGGGRRTRTTSAQPRRAGYRLVCKNSDQSTARTVPLDAPSDQAAVAAARACAADGGCEVWRTGEEPEKLGSF